MSTFADIGYGEMFLLTDLDLVYHKQSETTATCAWAVHHFSATHQVFPYQGTTITPPRALANPTDQGFKASGGILSGMFVRTVPNVMLRYRCDEERAQLYIDLRDEGYPSHQALVMAGLGDPSD